MSDDQQTTQDLQSPELDREGRRLQRLRLVSQVSAPPERFDDDPDPREAA
jgi:hypothetical protein